MAPKTTEPAPENPIAHAIEGIVMALHARSDFPPHYNLTDAFVKIAEGLSEIASALRMLGTADAATPMGAIEAHAVAATEAMSSAAGELSTAITEAATTIAEAMKD